MRMLARQLEVLPEVSTWLRKEEIKRGGYYWVTEVGYEVASPWEWAEAALVEERQGELVFGYVGAQRGKGVPARLECVNPNYRFLPWSETT